MESETKCLMCGNAITSGSSNKKYCSISCRRKSTYRKKCRAPVLLPCLMCGNVITSGSSNKKYCSISCRKKSERRKKCRAPVLLCLMCGNAMTNGRADKKYCSRSCRKKSYQDATTIVNCDICNKICEGSSRRVLKACSTVCRFKKYCANDTESNCLIWNGTFDKKYKRPVFHEKRLKTVLAFKFNYELHKKFEDNIYQNKYTYINKCNPKCISIDSDHNELVVRKIKDFSLTKEEMMEISHLIKNSKLSRREIAEKFKTSTNVISFIAAGIKKLGIDRVSMPRFDQSKVDEAIKLFKLHWSYVDIAKKLGMSASSVALYVNKKMKQKEYIEESSKNLDSDEAMLKMLDEINKSLGL